MPRERLQRASHTQSEGERASVLAAWPAAAQEHVRLLQQLLPGRTHCGEPEELSLPSGLRPRTRDLLARQGRDASPRPRNVRRRGLVERLRGAAGGRDAARCDDVPHGPSQDPELYLWGARVGGGAPSIYPALAAARDKLEKDIRKYRTEPDIMLVIPEKLVVCVEAKFGSANTLASSGATKNDEKPHDVPGLIARYLDAASPCAQAAIDRASIGPKLHSQLFRNVVFAAEMAQGRDWHVVNLVSATQWKGRPNSATASFTDPCEDVRRYLASTFKECFAFRTWEALYRELVSKQRRASAVSTYLRSKTAHYRAAFELG